mgnify:CR=1 FL=1|tara:strand:+ start:4278 stop:5081 length:804 start_codon:yes stop_codon:yes gene_type:complete
MTSLIERWVDTVHYDEYGDWENEEITGYDPDDEEVDNLQSPKTDPATKLSLKKQPGPPPRPGLQWKPQTHRWIRPRSGMGEKEKNASKKMFGVNFFQREKLSQSERNAIQNYAGFMHIPMNDFLRTKDEDIFEDDLKRKKEIENAIVLMDEGISKRQMAKEQILFRGAEVKLDQIQEGQIYKDEAFISTTDDPYIADVFFVNARFDIHVPEGTNFGFGSREESEIILPRNSYFRIRSIKQMDFPSARASIGTRKNATVIEMEMLFNE